MDIKIGKGAEEILDKLNIGMGRRFNFFGGTGLLVSIWVNNELGLKISLITFIFGGFAKMIEMSNKKIKDNVVLQIMFWFIFLILYIFIIIVIWNWSYMELETNIISRLLLN